MSNDKWNEAFTAFHELKNKVKKKKKKKATLLTNIKLKALLSERVAASSGPIMLLQNQDFFSNFGQQHRKSKPTNPTADDDGIQVVRYFTFHKSWGSDNKTWCMFGMAQLAQ